MALIKAGKRVEDPFVDASAAEAIPPSGPVIVSLAQWQAQRDALLARGTPLGIRLHSDQSPEAIADDVKHFAAIALEFPKFRDGRAYSYARLLRERYGFVAADEMLRAVTLMLRNTVRELGEDEDFVGHLSDNEFVVLTTPRHGVSIRTRIETRLRNSLQHFYRAEDQDASFLTLDVGTLVIQLGQYDTVALVKQALRDTIAPAATSS
jgi:uncharacterized protein (DUF934 family)